MFYIAGSFDTLTSTGGSEMVLATGGNNTINLSGSGNNTVYLSGGNNVINIGSGYTAITEAASMGDRIILPGAGTGFDAVTLLSGADPKLDFTAALRATTWGRHRR
jgi:Ca2+-binding RTX toxin-like protein